MPKVVDHESYRAELLNGAFALFARVGFAASTMRGIARELGVSTGTLYHYFETKDALFDQLVQHVSQQSVAEALRDVSPAATPQERLDTLFRFVREHEVHLRNFLFVLLDYHRAQPGGDASGTVREALLFFRDAIVRHVGTVQPALAALVLSGILGTLLQRSLDEATVDFDEQVTYLHALMSAMQG
jgi:AcrR family transcriptional regulator